MWRILVSRVGVRKERSPGAGPWTSQYEGRGHWVKRQNQKAWPHRSLGKGRELALASWSSREGMQCLVTLHSLLLTSHMGQDLPSKSARRDARCTGCFRQQVSCPRGPDAADMLALPRPLPRPSPHSTFPPANEPPCVLNVRKWCLCKPVWMLHPPALWEACLAAWLGRCRGVEGGTAPAPPKPARQALRTLPALDELRDRPSWLPPAAARAQLPHPKKHKTPGTDIADVP